MDNINIRDWQKKYLLKEEVEEPQGEEVLYILLDTFKDDEEIFTGASKTKEGIEALKQSIIDKFNITDPEELMHLHIHEVPLDQYFAVRQQADSSNRTASFK